MHAILSLFKRIFKRQRQEYLITGLLALSLFTAYPFVDVWLTPDLPTLESPILFYSTEDWKDMKRMYLKAIREAKKSILLSMFTLKDKDVVALLKEKSREGVRVTLILDKKASETTIKYLEKPIEVVAKKMPGLMHQKILIIDNALSWIGSANFTKDSFDSHSNFVSGFYSEELAEFLRGHLLKENPLSPYRAFEIAGQKLEISFQPEDKKASQRVIELLKSAKKTLFVAMYTFTRIDFCNEIIAAKKRGVESVVVLDRSMTKNANKEVWKRFKANGVPVFRNSTRGLLHYKMMMVDGHTLLQGSTNWTRRGFTENKECFMILYNLREDQKNRLEYLQERILASSRS